MLITRFPVTGVPNHALYAGSKAAVEGFIRFFPVDCGYKSITVNAITPGGVKTASKFLIQGYFDRTASKLSRFRSPHRNSGCCSQRVGIERIDFLLK
jgi:NAD(P)-dependent dehydrogenase (short-subunit alcohol dehydrogenase family)